MDNEYKVRFCYPEGNISAISKFFVYAATMLAGEGSGGFINSVNDAAAYAVKKTLGGLPVPSRLILDDSVTIRPNKMAKYLVDNLKEIVIPTEEITKVEKHYNLLLDSTIITVYLNDTKIKFLVTPVWGKADKIKARLQSMI